MGDVDRAKALEWPRADAGHIPSDTAQEEAAISSRHPTKTAGTLTTLLVATQTPGYLCLISHISTFAVW